MYKINGRTPEESVYTLEEVKKGLECCVGLDKDRPLCLDCPYRTHCEKRHCSDVLRQDTLAYIQQLESELAEALKDVDMLGEQAVALDGAYDAMKRERDAAVEILHDFKTCAGCNHKGCANCRWFDDITMKNKDLHDNWQWRGVQEEKR